MLRKRPTDGTVDSDFRVAESSCQTGIVAYSFTDDSIGELDIQHWLHIHWFDSIKLTLPACDSLYLPVLEC